MRLQLIILMSFGLLASVAISGCQQGPDLVPVKAPGNMTFCEMNEEGQLVVYIKNQGTADVPTGCEVEVKFNMGNGVQKTVRGATGPISAGATDAILISIPGGCFNADCGFTITVDIVNTVKEINEQNNSVDGLCIG